MPVLRIGLAVRVAHQGVVLEDAPPVCVVSAVRWVLLSERLDRDLVAVVVLEYQVAEV